LKNIFIKHLHKFKQSKIGIFETSTNAYNLVHIGCQLAVKTKNNPIAITTGIKNLLNKKYTDHLSRFKEMEIPNQGINYYLGITFNVSKSI